MRAVAELFDLRQDLLARLRGHQAPVDGDAAALRQMVRAVVVALDMGDGDGGTAEERIFRQASVQLLDTLDNLGDAVDGVEALVRGRGMHGLTAQGHLDFGAAALPSA